MKIEKEEFTWHDSNEMPEFYPDKMIPITIDDKKVVLLTDCHSKYYIATDSAKKELQNELKKFKYWAYFRNREKD